MKILTIPVRFAKPFLPFSVDSTGFTKLFITGTTVGPIVDSLHNQCLLRYNVAPINIEWPTFITKNAVVDKPNITHQSLAFFFQNEYLLCSSWTVPLLLGFAYVVLGGILPQLLQHVIDVVALITNNDIKNVDNNDGNNLPEEETKNNNNMIDRFLNINNTYTSNASKSKLLAKALIAVLSTAAIIKFSEYLVVNPSSVFSDNVLLDRITNIKGQQHLLLLFAAALCQWVVLDGTLAAFIAAWITSIGGPLSELPFVASGIWTYLPDVADKTPLVDFPDTGIFFFVHSILVILLGDNYQDIAISSVSAPCYFAVTMDAIALGRWFSKKNPGA